MQEYEQAVFISYAWGGESEEIVDQIDQALQQRGLKFIRDKRDLGYKGSISAFMGRIGQGNCVIVVISDKYLRSPNCMFELVEIAEGKQFHDRVFPIVLSNAEIYDPVKRLQYVKHWEDKLAELDQAMRGVGQANLQGIREEIDQYSRIRDKVSGLTSVLKDMNTLTPDMHKDSDFGEIYTGIDKRLAGASGEIKPESEESPYMGLRYFDTSDADLFFGREALTSELAERVAKESFLAIVGASGSGKSSVARAGLIPAWKKENERGAVHVITPTAHPLESLAASLTRDSESVTATSTMMDDMQKDSRSLRLNVKKLGIENFLLVVDQFEETFTLCKEPAERKAFIENLLSLADEDSTARVVITLRADFYHYCFEYEGLRLAFEDHQANIGAMTQDELREAIVQPAANNGWNFQSGLVDLILQDVGTEPGALPLLSHALLETWKRRQGHMLSFQCYHEAGGVKKAITQTADIVYDKLLPDEQEIARNIFLHLTELGEGVQDTRRRVRIDQLAQAKEQEAVTKVLKTLTDARLVTTERDSAEVAHEVLIREWGTLRIWLDEDRENLLQRRDLTKSALEWERMRKNDDYLVYRGERLELALRMADSTTNSLSETEIKYLSACSDRETKEKENQRWADFSSYRTQLLANVSHELRTPINSIVGLSRVILKGIDGPVTDMQVQDLTAIYNSGKYILGLVNDIMDLSLIEKGQLRLEFEEVKLSELINSVLSTTRGLIKEKPIQLISKVPPDLPTVRGDTLRVRQVLLNLLSNASKFTDEGLITVESTVQIGPNGKLEALINVIDTGPGISSEGQKKLFKAFSQVDGSVTRKSGGSGLGLSISANLVQLHGGRIGVHSQEGKGSTFWFTMPLFNQPSEAIPENKA